MSQGASPIDPTGRDSNSDAAQLEAALTKARALVQDLESKAADLASHPASLPTEQLAAGRAAMESAVASARRLLQSLETARRVTDGGPAGSSNETSEGV